MSPRLLSFAPIAAIRLLLAGSMCTVVHGQTAPVPQPLPYVQDFGTAGFATMPAGTAAWNGLNGGTINSATVAAGSTPTGDATVTSTGSPTQNTGGCYGYAVSGNARFYIQTSGSSPNGANQLAIAVSTLGKIGITLGYKAELIRVQERTVGTVCQYRIGTSGSWTTVTPSIGTNPASSVVGGSTGDLTSVSATLPVAAENQEVVQIRWAVWRGNEGGNSSGLAIDDISVTGTTPSSSVVVTASPDSFSEAAGPGASTVTVTTTEAVTADTSVTLTSGDTSEAVVAAPNTKVIPAGSSSVTFMVNAVDDGVFDGTQTVSLNAVVAGQGSASTTVTVTDDEDAYSPPASYYAPAEGLTGSSLKSALNTIIKAGHTQYTYSNTYGPLRVLYEDPENTSNVITVYSRESIGKTVNYYPGGPDASASWSREHTWPDSYGLDPTNVNPGSTDGDAGPDFTDLFNLRPELQTVNSQRGNKYYDDSTGSVTVPQLAPESSYDNDSFEPPASVKGDLARAMFYMATRYDGTEPMTLDLELDNSPSSATGRFAKLSTLLKWHEEDPVSEEERKRNQLIYSNYQHNRNPFVDHPEYVALIWGTLRVSETAVAVTEGGATDTYQLTLTSQPASNVTVNISSTPTGQLTTSPSSVTFTTANWNVPVTVTVTAVDDTVYESAPVAVTIRHTFSTSDPYYSTLSPTDLPATVTDNDPLIAPATLPIAYGGPWDTLPTGFLGVGTGTYSTSLGGDTGTGSARFDNTGDKLTVAFNSTPGALSYYLLGNPANGTATQGVFDILESPDNTNFTTVRSVLNKSNVPESYTDTLLSTTRYVVFRYTTKTGGNIQMDKLAISADVTQTPAEQWLALYSLSGFGGDGDHDGLTDLAEYALGGVPNVSDLAERAPVVTKTAGGLRITAVVKISDTALAAVAQVTTDLSNVNAWTTSGVTKLSGVSQDGVASGYERVTFEVDDAGARMFLRLVFVLD